MAMNFILFLTFVYISYRFLFHFDYIFVLHRLKIDIYKKEMKYCNSLVFGLAIASLSVVVYIIGGIFFTTLLIKSERNLQHSNTLPIIFLVICLVMSIVSSLLIFGIVKVMFILKCVLCYKRY